MGARRAGARRAALGGLTGVAVVLTVADRLLAEPGMEARLTIGEKLRYVDENGFSTPQKEGGSAVTTLDYNLTSETANQTFELDLSTAIPIYASDSDNADANYTLEDPSARVNYTRESRSSALSFASSYRRSDLGTSNFFDETINEDVVTGGGKRELKSVSAGLVLGRETPVQTDLNYGYLRSTYKDADPGLSDSTTNTLDGRITFRLNPAASAFAFAEWREEDRDLASQSDRTTSAVGLGTTIETSAITQVTAQLSYDRDEIGDSLNEGAGFRLGLDHDVPTGAYTLAASGTETIDGFQQQVSAGRSYDMALGSISFTLGAVKEEGTSIEPLANAAIDLELTQTSRLNIALSQTPSFDADDLSVIRTRLDIGYDLEIDRLSSLSATVRMVENNALGSGARDARSVLASVSYNRAIAPGWDLVGAISYEADQNDGRTDTDTSTISLGLERTFNFRP